MEMICHREKCTGCMACVNACRFDAICMTEDDQGFAYPHINQKLCLSCGKCKKVCPQNAASIMHEPKQIYAMLAKEDVLREKSSSGGVFSLIARDIMKNKGVVFGAAFDKNWRVVHCMAQTEDELESLRTSKYVQSDIGFTFREVKKLLDQKQHVLFVGTPCQIDGLYKYLGGDNINLLTIDLVCHGVPSPGVFSRWIDYEMQLHGVIESISFRKKKPGWKTFRAHLQFQNGEVVECKQSEGYMAGFLRNIYLRESCYRCPYACTSRIGDLTLGDYWGYQETPPEFIEDDDRGISLVLVNTKKGEAALKRVYAKVDCALRTIQDAVQGNVVLQRPAVRSKEYEVFWQDYKKLSWKDLANRYMPPKPEQEDPVHPLAREYYFIPYRKRHWKHRIVCIKASILEKLKKWCGK